MVILHGMKRPIFVRPFSDAERETLEAGLRSSDAFTLRRCQILLASDRGENAYEIARSLGCNPQTARRDAIDAFSTRRGCPKRFSKAPSAHTPFPKRLSRVPSRPRLCGSCFTTTPAASARARACGRWISPPRSVSRRASHRSASRARPSEPPWRGWGCAGSGPSDGSLLQIPSMREKKAARPIDPPRREPS